MKINSRYLQSPGLNLDQNCQNLLKIRNQQLKSQLTDINITLVGSRIAILNHHRVERLTAQLGFNRIKTELQPSRGDAVYTKGIIFPRCWVAKSVHLTKRFLNLR